MLNLVVNPELDTLRGAVANLDSKIGGTLEIVKGAKRVQSLEALKSESSNITSASRFPEVVLYEHRGFTGANWRTNLSYDYVGDWWNDKVSSIVVVSGVWQFCQHAYRQGASWYLRPGYYAWVETEANIPNDIISSFYCVEL